MENWLPIPGYETFYAVSDQGHVRNIRNRKILKQCLRKDGYIYTQMWICGKNKSVTNHRLVALAFIGQPPPDKPQINHKDGNKSNNTPDNLEWCNHLENMRHSYRVLGRKNRHGEKVNTAKLKTEQVIEIRILRQQGMKIKELVQKFNTPTATITDIIYRKTWKHLNP